ncbi:hypothetical protein ZWY2020_016643 [Hordeum vulgare]|nr:hypothetical protein ZWY2020_016643 [Hordeum vulgare]
MAEGVLASVLAKFGSSVWGELTLLRSFRTDLRAMEDEFATIRSVLADAEVRGGSGDSAVRDWLRRLKNLAHDIDDFLDACHSDLRAARRRRSRGNPACGSAATCIVNSVVMAHRLRSLRRKLDAIAAGRDRLRLNPNVSPPAQPVAPPKRETISKVDEAKTVGRAADKEKLMKIVLDAASEEDVSVIPIVGFGGLGKTTLAQLVFNDRRANDEVFDLRIWVSMSVDFSLRRLIQPIVSATKRKRDLTSLEEIANFLSETFTGKKYLLVLDDVWSENQDEWERLKLLLKDGKRGSKIMSVAGDEVQIVNSKNANVRAEACCHYASLGDDMGPSEVLRSTLRKARALHSWGYALDVQLLLHSRCLRVLDLRGSQIMELPKSVGRLKHLSFLCTLPSSIGDLQSDTYSSIAELKDLNLLSGCLKIECCSHKKDLTNDAKRANLRNKRKLSNLTVSWTSSCSSDELKNVETFLEVLLPPENLEVLEIYGYMGAKFPSWMVESMECWLPNITFLSLANIPNCICLPPLGHIPNLHSLELRCISGVRSIEPEILAKGQKNTLYQSLKELHFEDMPDLEIWPTSLAGDSEESQQKVFMFPVLKTVTKRDRQGLVQDLPYPKYPHLVTARTEVILQGFKCNTCA